MSKKDKKNRARGAAAEGAQAGAEQGAQAPEVVENPTPEQLAAAQEDAETKRDIVEDVAAGASVPAETPAQEAVRKSRNTPADIKAVMELRLAGATYMQIEEAMGWPDQHGNRPYRICKDLGIAGGRVKKAVPAPANAFEGVVPSDADLAAAQAKAAEEGAGSETAGQ